MSARASEFPTLHEILASQSGGKGPTAKSVKNLRIQPIQRREATTLLTPEQLAGVRVPLQQIAGDQIRGYQRHLNATQARDFAKFLDSYGDDSYLRVVPVVEISVTGDHLFFTDGQHRAAGAILAGKPIEVKLTKRSMTEARKLFSLQRKSRAVSRTVAIFNGDSPQDVYIQDAATTPHDHPWKHMIARSAETTRTRISANTISNMLRSYMGQNFDESAANELAVLISAFGTKAENTPAFRAKPLASIVNVARRVFRERSPHPEDKARWATHMLKFNFAYVEYMPVSEITLRLAKHWNSGLPRDSHRRIAL